MKLAGKTVLITGIGGFIGSHLAQRAMTIGMKVKGLQRSEHNLQNLRQLGAEVILGDITDPIAVEKACKGVDIVLHTAAVVKETGSMAYFRKVNVEGSLNMAIAAKKASVQMFVHLSSVMVYGFNYVDRINEEGELSGDNNAYCQTKIESEQELIKFNETNNIGLIIIRAGDVYGARSNSWVTRPLQLMEKKMLILPNGGKGIINHVYIDPTFGRLGFKKVILGLDKKIITKLWNRQKKYPTSKFKILTT